MDISYKPEWAKFEEKMKRGDVNESVKATDAFLETREKELKKDKKAREWEKSRKEAIAKDKPLFVKERINKERQELERIDVKQRYFGEFDKFKPSRGYLLVVTDKMEEKSIGGIVLQSSNQDNNSGYVYEMGDNLLGSEGYEYPLPCQKGNHIIFKRGAGMNIEIEGEKCRFLQFSDVLGITYDK